MMVDLEQLALSEKACIVEAVLISPAVEIDIVVVDVLTFRRSL